MDKTLLKFWTYFSAIVIIGLFGFLVQTAWWIWYPYDIVKFENHCCNENGSYFQGKIVNEDGTPKIEKTVRRGETLHIKIKFNKRYDMIAHNVVRELVNDRYVTLVCNDKGTLQKGENEKIFSIFIPYNVWPGKKYMLSNSFEYHPNPFRSIKEGWSSERFEVLP